MKLAEVSIVKDFFEVHYGTEIIKSCPTEEEANFWKDIWEAHQKEYDEITSKAFYKSNDSVYRMVIVFVGSNKYHCRLISPNGDTHYSTYTKEYIDKNFTVIAFSR